MPRLAHCTRPSAPTAITASCMLLRSVSSSCWLVCTRAKLSSTRRAVLSSAAATWPISSDEVDAIRAVRSPPATRSAKLTMRSKRQPRYCE